MSLPKEKGPRSLQQFAVLCVAVWTLAVLAAQSVGIWTGIGSAAVLLGVPALAFYSKILVPMLRPSRRLLGVGLLGALLLLGATYTLYPALGAVPGEVHGQAEALYARFRDTPLLLRCALLPTVVLAEELVWRGIIQEVLTRGFGPLRGMAMAAAAFGAAHLPFGYPLLAAVAFGCGLVWGSMRLGSRSLVPPLICHLAWDVMVFNLAPLA